ncbi:hypothetical protein EUTSA_v10002236mg, partial [Eutrema salsugineum]
NLKRISSPSFLEDGTPVVEAPPSVLLQAAETWKGHIVAHFHGAIPPPSEIYADLNPVWGKFGNISIQTISKSSCLFFIPSIPTREWVLECPRRAIGEPLHTEKSKLDPYHLGDTKVKVEIQLDRTPPNTVIVKDTQGFSVRGRVEYPRLPPKCCNCNRFGHLLNRCPHPLMKRSSPKPSAGSI